MGKLQTVMGLIKYAYNTLYIDAYQIIADVVIMQLNMINILSNDIGYSEVPSFMKNIHNRQFEKWLMWGVNLDVKMTHKGIYLN